MRERLRIDPWGPLLALAGLGVFLLQGFEGALTRDLALYAYSGQQFAEGSPPYVAVLNRAGPLAHVLPGLGAIGGRAVGVDDVLAMRVLMMLVSVACVWVLYLLARDTFASRLGGAVAAVTLLNLEGFVEYASGGPREKTTMVLFALLALWAVVRRRWAGAGVATALATLSWQPIFFALALGAIVAALLVPGGRARMLALARFAGGGIAVVVVTVAAFAAAGAVSELYEGFLKVNLSHTTQRSFLDTITNRPRTLVSGYGPAVYVGLAGLLWLVVAPLVRLRRLDRDSGASCGQLAIGVATLVSVLWALRAFQAWPDFFGLIPFAPLGVAGLVLWLTSPIPRRWATGVLVTAVVLALVLAGVASWQTRSERIVVQRAETEALLDIMGPDATVLSVGAPQPLVFSGQRNAIRHQMFRGGLAGYLDETQPGGLEAIAAQIEDARPTFIVFDVPRRYPWLYPLLDRSYVKAGGSWHQYVWFVTDDVTDAQLEELQEVFSEPTRRRRGQAAGEQVGVGTAVSGVERSVP